MITIAVYNQVPLGYNGITLKDSSNVTVANNTIEEIRGVYELVGGVYVGICLEGGGSNTIVGNNLYNNEYSVYISGTENNLIVENNIIDNESQLISSGFLLEQAFNNRIFHNNFVFPAQVIISNSSNTWDDSFPGGGNYWSDYQTKYPNASEIDSSGIGDTPYVIDSNNTDRYPLMEPFNSTANNPAPSPSLSPSPSATSPTTEPFPTTLVATASGASAAIIGIALLAYLKKRNR
jgi:parallel beta-helix repeat protein